jgi:type VI secretion system ImpA family protein
MIAAWLTEALMHQHGFAGLRQGLMVVNGLVESYWEPLYPRPDEGDWEPRAAPLVWLTEPDRGARLPNFLRELPLAPNSSGDGEEYSYNYWEARTPKGAAGDDEEAYARRQAEAARKAQQFDDAVAATSRDYYAALLGDIQGCTAEFARFDKALDQLLGRDAPGTTAVRDSIAKCDDLVRRILRNKGGAESSDAEGEAPEGGTAEGGSGGPAGPVRSREDAFRRLEEIAAFLRRTEPQSPVSYLVERAVAWGRMPFGRLLGELIKDEASRGQVVDLLGIKEDPQ